MTNIEEAQNKTGHSPTDEQATVGRAIGTGTVEILCESCDRGTLHMPIDADSLKWVRASGDKATTHYCIVCAEKAWDREH